MLRQKWAGLRLGAVKVKIRGAQYLFEAQVFLNDLDPKAVRVELYADGVDGGSSVRQEMNRGTELASASDGYVYDAAVPAARPLGDYTVRVMPRYDGVAIPLEEARIIWQR
jgi:starch phosphorylase